MAKKFTVSVCVRRRPGRRLTQTDTGKRSCLDWDLGQLGQCFCCGIVDGDECL